MMSRTLKPEGLVFSMIASIALLIAEAEFAPDRVGREVGDQ